MVNQKRSCSIDIMRYICSIMVVAIHTVPFKEVNSDLAYFCSQVFPRIAVPFFFAVSGFFYMRKLESGRPVFVRYIKKLVTTYLLWSVPYFIIDFIEWGHKSLIGFVFNCGYSFFITGSSYHFWFFPALIFSVCVVTIVYRIKCNRILLPMSTLLYIVGCLGCSYYNVGIKIPGLNGIYMHPWFTQIRRILLMGFPFFVCGGIMQRMETKVHRIRDRWIWISVVLAIIVFVAEIYLVESFHLCDNVIITFGLYVLVCAVLLCLMKHPMPQRTEMANCCRVLANFTYYLHPLLKRGLLALGTCLGLSELSPTLMFAALWITTSAIGFLIYKCNNKILNILVS